MKFTTERPYFWLFATLALVGLAADQASKYVVFAKLYPDGPERQAIAHVVIPNWFSLVTNYSDKDHPSDGALSFLQTISGERVPLVNEGALFGMGHGMNSVFAGISLVAAVFIVCWVMRPAVAKDRWLCLALGLILAGTLGNLYDRLVFSGVRDFLHCYYVTEEVNARGEPFLLPHIWPDFNIADCCLVSGASILLVHSFFAKDPVAEPAKPELAAAAAPAPVQTVAPTPGA